MATEAPSAPSPILYQSHDCSQSDRANFSAHGPPTAVVVGPQHVVHSPTLPRRKVGAQTSGVLSKKKLLLAFPAYLDQNIYHVDEKSSL